MNDCQIAHKTWADITTSTRSDCLSIFYDFAVNGQSRNRKWNDHFTQGQLADSYALHLSQNQLFMDTIAKIDQVQLRKNGQREKARFK